VEAENEMAARGEEGDRGQVLHVVAQRDLLLLLAAFGVDLDRDEVLGPPHHGRIRVRRLLELMAPEAPLRPEVHEDRLLARARLLETLVEAAPPLDAARGAPSADEEGGEGERAENHRSRAAALKARKR